MSSSSRPTPPRPHQGVGAGGGRGGCVVCERRHVSPEQFGASCAWVCVLMMLMLCLS